MDSALEHFLRYLKVERNASEHTIEAYRRDILQFQGFVEQDQAKPGTDGVEDRLSTTTPLMIRLWLGTLLEHGLERASVARKAASVRSFFKYSHRRGFVDHNPAQLLIIPKQAKRIPTVVSENEIDQLLNTAGDGTAWNNQEIAILELFYATGIRLSELITLNLDDLDLQQRQISVIGKGQKQRIVPFGATAYEAISRHLATRNELLGTEKSENKNDDEHAVFLTKKGKRIYPRLVQKLVNERLNEVSETNKKSPHVLRHSFATHMLNAGADIRLIKEFLGHSSLAATQVYTHTGVEHLKKIHEQSHPRAKAMERSSHQGHITKTENGDTL